MRSLLRGPGRILESIFAVAGLFLATDAVLAVQRTDAFGFNIDQYQGDPRTQMLFAAMYAITFALLAAHRRAALAVFKRGGWAWLLVVLAIVSAGWSEAPEVSLRRAVALVGSSAFGVFLATRFNRRELILLLATAMGLVMVASLVAIRMGPGVVPFGGHQGLWRGAFGQKNIFARMIVLAMVSFGLAARLNRTLMLVAIPSIVVSLWVLLHTGSATGLTMPLALAALVPALLLLRRRPAAAMPLLSLILAAGVLVMIWGLGNFGGITQTLGRDTSLTGRTELWDGMIHEIKKSPWVGYGYAGFWLGQNGPSDHVWGRIEWQPLHGHNGFLDLLADFGVVGISLFVAILVRSFWRARALLRRDHDVGGLFPALFCCLILLYNVTESVIIKPNSIFWPLFVAVCLLLPKGPRITSTARPTVAPEPASPWLTPRTPALLEPVGPRL